MSGASVATLRGQGAVGRAERERVFHDASSALDEPLFGGEWWRAAIGADVEQAPGPGKPVTIVDSGLDITHEEFSSRPNTTLLNKQTTVLQDEDHGTEVASVAAAPVNGVGIAGVYPQAVLRSWDASPFGFITTGQAVRGIVTAANGGPGVINISFGGDNPDPAIRDAVAYAVRHGSLVVASAGNGGLGGSPLEWPASYPHVLTVAATDPNNVVAAFSSRSRFVDLAAPGQHIEVAEPLTVDPTGYSFASGTSFSAPIVAAASAWVWTVRPELDNTQLAEVMRLSAHDIDAPGVDRATGFGLLNIPSAVAFAAPPSDPLEPNDAIDEVSPSGLFTGGEPGVLTPAKRSATLVARVDRFEDPHDVYRAFVAPGATLAARAAGGAVELRIYSAAARTLGAKPLAVNKRGGSVTARNRSARGLYLYVEVRPAAGTARTAYTLQLTSSARR